MGFLDSFLDLVGTISEFSEGSIHDRKFKVTCTTLEIFEIGTQWKGTARIHGAGEHVKTIKVDYETTITLPYKDDDLEYSRRGLLRKQLRDWLGKTLAEDGKIVRENIVLNPSENCLSVEGFTKKVGDEWLIVDSAYEATNFCAYKLFLKDISNNSKVGHDELHELFMEETRGYITSVDVTEGF